MRNVIIHLMVVVCGLSFANEVSIYEIDGRLFNSLKKTKGPKILVKSIDDSLNVVGDIVSEKSIFINRDTVYVALQDSIHWLEVEKNRAYIICSDDVRDGMWKGADFSYKKENNCIQLNSGNYVKSGKIWYVTNMGNVHTFNILVGLKYIDLSKGKHLIGSLAFDTKRKNTSNFLDFGIGSENRIYPDSLKYVKIEKKLVVDKYKVTDCELIQTLWDSIPDRNKIILNTNKKYWVEKKEHLVKGAYCDLHDSAAIRVKPYWAMIYANARSVRDGFEPVYTFEWSDWKTMRMHGDGSFGIRNESFFLSEKSGTNFVLVHVNEFANGYRLPYYDEWMALARGGRLNIDFVWGDDKDSLMASQYAWFGFRNVELNPKNVFDEEKMQRFCGIFQQNSRPVGMLKPNVYGLYDVSGLVCELTMLAKKSIFDNEVLICKGGFLTDSLESLNLRNHCDYKTTNDFTYQGLRLVRQIR